MLEHLHTDEEATYDGLKNHVMRQHVDDASGWELESMGSAELYRFHRRSHHAAGTPTNHEHGSHRHGSPITLLQHLVREHGVDLDPKESESIDWQELEHWHADLHPDEKFSWDPRKLAAVMNEDDGGGWNVDKMARDFVGQMGYDETGTNIEQMKVYIDAFEIFVERNERYEDLWKQYGWMDTLTHVRSKALRLVRKFWREDPEQEDETLLDDALDLVNYATFFIRNFRSGNKWGW